MNHVRVGFFSVLLFLPLVYHSGVQRQGPISFSQSQERIIIDPDPIPIVLEQFQSARRLVLSFFDQRTSRRGWSVFYSIRLSSTSVNSLYYTLRCDMMDDVLNIHRANDECVVWFFAIQLAQSIDFFPTLIFFVHVEG